MCGFAIEVHQTSSLSALVRRLCRLISGREVRQTSFLSMVDRWGGIVGLSVSENTSHILSVYGGWGRVYVGLSVGKSHVTHPGGWEC